MRHLLKHKSDIYRGTLGAANAHGQKAKTWAVSSASEPCFYRETKGEQLDSGKGLVSCDAKVFFGADADVKEADRILFNGQTLEVDFVKACRTPRGVHHYEVGANLVREAD